MNQHTNLFEVVKTPVIIQDEIIFSLNNPVIASHKINKQSVLPGLAYIDIIFQFLRKHKLYVHDLEIRNLVIHNSLAVADNYRLTVSFTCNAHGEVKRKIRIEAKLSGDVVSQSGSLLYATAEIWPKKTSLADANKDLSLLKNSARISYPIEDIYAQYRTMGLEHSGFMKAGGTIYETAEGLLFEGSVGQAALPTANRYMFHPALLDASAIATMRLFNALVKQGDLFLPLYYESFHGVNFINKSCYAFVPLSSIAQKHEITTLSIHYFDSRGGKIGELKNLTSKIVRRRDVGFGNDSRKLITSSSKPALENEKAIISRYLKRIIAAPLNIVADEVDIEVGYYDLGLDSARLLQLVDVISQEIKIDLPPTLLFEYSNIASLTDYLHQEYGGRFELNGTVQSRNGKAADYHTVNRGGHSAAPKDSRRSKKDEYASENSSCDIAIVGVAGRYPQASNIHEFWENLLSGKDCITKIPLSRWDSSLHRNIKSPSGKDISQWGGFIEEADRFDPMFFRISAREAEVMDPQERLFLQICWHALEDAGYTPGSLVDDKSGRRKVGVFAGVMHKDYTLIGNDALAGGATVPLAMNNASIANRVSYFCNFNGPSMVIDTACSSSLVAVHLAAQSILAGECEAAIAGGVNLSLHPGKYLSYGLIDMHSSDGHCKAFGKGGDGYVSAEGVGAILLKPLRKAAADNDQIYAVIKASSVNHVGSVGGLTVPSPAAQAAVIKDCLDKACVDAHTLGYLEAHGTGTSLGDPIEIQGLVKAFSEFTDDKQFCSIGSVKSNIGHAEAAAGISGLTKLLLQFKYKTLVPSLHAGEYNPHLNLRNSPFYVQQEVSPWMGREITKDGVTTRYPLRAGLSSFGASGTNAHIVLEEYTRVEEKVDGATGDIFLIPVSARDKERLHQSVENLSRFLSQRKLKSESTNLLDIAYTLQVGRLEMDERVVFIVSTLEKLTEQMNAYLAGKAADCFEGNVKRTRDNFNSQDAVDLRLFSGTEDELRTLARAWISGKTTEWKRLYEDRSSYRRSPRRISLPTYPFIKEHYWISNSKPDKMHVDTQRSNGETREVPKSGESDATVHPLPAAINQELLAESLTAKVKTLFADVVKFNVMQIEIDEPLENYGIDSIVIVELNKILSTAYKDLPSTLFYECQTLAAVCRYLIHHRPEESADWTDLKVSELEKKPAHDIAKISGNRSERSGYHAAAGSKKISPSGNDTREPIAIIGINGRYAGAENLRQFWDSLKNGRDCITEIPKERWALDDFFHADSSQAASLGMSYGKWGSFITGFADFDAQFFNITPREAKSMDPHIRIFLESCWQVLEDAGYTRQRIAQLYNGNVGVFAGVTRTGFSFYAPDLIKNGQYPLNSLSAVANRVSYILNLKGPSVPVDTMCSSSLTAIHEACESLLQGRCEMAIAGGVNLLLHPTEYVMLSANNFLSSDGKCRSFGAGGDGYVPGEGVGTVLLKPLSKAIAENDHIYAVIRSTSVNHGGKTNGYTVPNPVAQSDLIRKALDRAGINARDISYVEGHGTGTSLGDPIEISGLTQAFKIDSRDTKYCAIGSLKSNIGHLEAAAGIAGVTKIILQLQHKTLVPSLHSKELNPNIDFEKSPFYVQQTLSEWKTPTVGGEDNIKERARIAGISSFGAGGANAHIILEEYIHEKIGDAHVKHDVQAPVAIVVSAKNDERLKKYVEELIAAMCDADFQDTQLNDIAYTLQIGREAMDARLALEVKSIEELVRKLKIFVEENSMTEGMFFGNAKENKETIAPLSSDKGMAATLYEWLTRKDYNRLLALWTKGLSVNWSVLYHDRSKCKPISLPAYPFERKKHWIIETENTQLKDAQINVLSNKLQSTIAENIVVKGNSDDRPRENEEHKLLTYEEVWEDEALPKTGVLSIKTLVCFISNSKYQESAIKALRDWSKDTTIVFISLETGSQNNAFNYCIDKIKEPESYQSAFDQIVAAHGNIDAMIYLWPLEDASLIRDHGILFAILQAVSARKSAALQFILAGAWEKQIEISENGLERCYLESWEGFCRSLRLIVPDLKLKIVLQELQPHQLADIDIKDWLSKLWHELQNQPTRSALYKEEKRYVQRIRSKVISQNDTRFRKNGTYLITGGLGNLGLLVSDYLARRFSANLILTGRKPVDSQKQEAIKKLKEFGSNVMYIQSDICNETEMLDKLKMAKTTMGAIHGVIHTAGVIGAETFPEKSFESFLKVLNPKVDGTILLDRVLKDEPLDFVCYFTSSSAVLGDFGACDYSIANRFQMAFASYRNQLVNQGLRSGRSIAINWPLWEEGGMDLNSADSTKMYLKSSGQRYLATAEGLEILEQIISDGAEQQLVFTGLESKIKRFLGIESVKLEKSSALSEDRISSSRKHNHSMRGWSLTQRLEYDLIDLVSNEQQIPKENLTLNENLADLGFDSISLTALARAFAKHFMVDVPPAIFFGYSTIGKLIEYFLKDHKKAVESLYAGDAESDDNQAREASEKFPAYKREEDARIGSSTKATQPGISIQSFTEPVAIIGMSGRFPEARSIEEMWEIIDKGRDVVREIPTERFDWRKYYSADSTLAEKTNCKWSGFVPGIQEFDSGFFEITPQEAELMDPRQRLLLQEAWKALEDAGYGPSQLKAERIGLYVGAEDSSYAEITKQPGLITNHNAILAARLSYFLNLSGPNMAINTACSSGLVAAHQAFQSLQTGDCDTALAAGVNLMLVPELYIGMTQAGMLSADGKCHTFDKEANGMVPGEAVVVIVMKRLSKAIADGDPIYATIRGSGLNYDGKTNGITAPNGLSQAALFKSVYDKYKLNPGEIEYVVTHGTGTRLGDPVEVNALADAFKEYTSKKNYCALTSVKTNFGHTFSASGLVSLVSLIMSFRNNTIPSSLHCNAESDYINWKESPFYVNKKNKAWLSEPGKERTGAINAFGMSGTNAHMVVQSFADSVAGISHQPPFFILVFSAKTPETLTTKIEDMVAFLESQTLQGSAMTDIAYTLLAGRHHFKYRYAIIVRDREDALHVLRQYAGKTKLPNTFKGEVSREFKELNSVKKYLEQLVESNATSGGNLIEYQENLHALADFYCQGYEIPFKGLYLGFEPKRIHLPTYPFARTHYWVSSEESSVNNLSTAVEQNKIDSVAVRKPLIENHKTILFDFSWKEKDSIQQTTRPDFNRHVIALCEQTPVFKNIIKSGFAKAEIIEVESDALTAAMKFERYAKHIFEKVLLLVKKNPEEKILFQVMIPAAVDLQFLHGIAGLLKTINIEHLNVKCQLISIDEAAIASEEIVNRIVKDISSLVDVQIKYEEGKRYVPDWKSIDVRKAPAAVNVWRDRGVYLITGGAGEIGLVFANEIIKKTTNSVIILTGRSILDEKKTDILHSLCSSGNIVEYVRMDVSSLEEVDNLVTNIRRKHGALHGIIHSAGVIQDSFFLNKTTADFEKVLSPKVFGLENLDNASKDEKLDFFVMFSSVAGVMGNVGQADYATANAYMNAFAAYRDTLVASGERSGRSLSINWPLWKDGGMHVNETAEETLRTLGLELLSSSAGVAAFYDLMMRETSDQVMVLYGDENTIKRKMLKEFGETYIPQGRKRRQEMQGLITEECLVWDLKNLVSQISKIQREKIDVGENLTDMGFDSITLTKLSNTLSAHFDIEVTPSLFFGYPTIEKITSCLLEQYGQLMEVYYREEDGISETSSFVNESVTSVGASKETNQKYAIGRNAVEPIAIIGMSGRFPDARNIDEMWDILSQGKDVVKEIPADRFNCQKYYSEVAGKGKMNCKWSGLIPGIREFDPLFFEISPKEAALMDPRQRLLLQEAWRALEDAGYGADHLRKNKIGMYVGAEESTYGTLTGNDGSITSNNSAILSARLSYFLNLTGPNMAINTACSSALVAVHQACLSLRNSDCDTALAAGVNLLYTPEPYVAMSNAGMLSPSGKCYVFDKRANGMVPGESVAVVVLKTLSRAMADGDPIYATIVGGELNYDGKTNGITAPSGVSQTTLLKSVYDRFGINPEMIEYIVAHGTGTILGDPIEVNALFDAFKKYTTKKSYCALTSAKSNFGHMMAASGLVSLINLVQAFKHEVIPASLHCQDENNYINWKESPFYVNKESKPWLVQPEKERTGAISSFGMSGTNAHMVLQSYTAQRQNDVEPPVQMLAFSAKTPESLSQKIADLADAMRNGRMPDVRMTDISYTLLAGRHHFKYRSAIIVRGREDGTYMLNQFSRNEKRSNLFHGEVPHDFRGQSMIKGYLIELAKQAGTSHSDKQKYQEILCALAEFYCQGYDIPADILFADFGAQRIHLPTYPFVREEYWADIREDGSEISTKRANNNEQNNREGHDNRDEVFYRAYDSELLQKNENVEALAYESTLTHRESVENSKSNTSLIIRVQNYLTAIVSTAINLRHDKIEIQQPLVNYGMDSIMLVQLKNSLENTFGELQHNLFFEHPSIKDLSQYFIEEYRELCNTLPEGNELKNGTAADYILQHETRDPFQVLQRIKQLISSVINLQADKINVDMPLEHYGLDSILMVQLKAQIEDVFGELPARVFYEYPTVHELSTYILKSTTEPAFETPEG